MEILREMIIQPRVILVETHGRYGAPTAFVASLLETRGYVVSDRGLAEPRLLDSCTKNDLQICKSTTAFWNEHPARNWNGPGPCVELLRSESGSI